MLRRFCAFDSTEDVERFCAKAAADGMIRAELDHQGRCLISKNGDASDEVLAERVARATEDCFAFRGDAQRGIPKSGRDG
jgi:hypothetical protein